MYKSDRGNKFGGGHKKFGGNKFGKRNFGGSGYGGKPALFKAVCDQCGKPCEVPFKPSGDRPVYCNNCFKKNDGGDFRRPGHDSRRSDRDSGKSFGGVKGGISQEQFEILNGKLDEILEALTGIAEEEDDDGDDDDGNGRKV